MRPTRRLHTGGDAQAGINGLRRVNPLRGSSASLWPSG